MAVYYQARSSEEINRHHLESKCPNIMKGRRTKDQWNMWHFMILKNHLFQPCSLFILLSSKFVYIYGISMCMQLFIFSYFFGVLIISWNRQHYLCFLKRFPCFILTGGKIGVLPQSSLIWACATASQRSAYKQKNGVHAREHLSCFYLSCLCFGFYPLFLGMEVVFIKYLNFHIVNDQLRSQALALFSSALESDLLTHRLSESCFYSFVHTFFSSLWTHRNPAALITEGSKKVII